jgi:hypothetical protein
MTEKDLKLIKLWAVMTILTLVLQVAILVNIIRGA